MKIMVVGAGHVGGLISCLLARAEGYDVVLVDSDQANLDAAKRHPDLVTQTADVTDEQAFSTLVSDHQPNAVMVCLPYFLNLKLAELAHQHQLHYFNLTEDVEVFQKIKALATNAKHVFVPACGLAPGLVDIIAMSLLQGKDTADEMKLRVGCLPRVADNALRYALVWSIDGLINEYGNTCYGLVQGKKTPLEPLNDLETLDIDGVEYEAFNTSGGVGNLVDRLQGRVKTLNYKSLRYPGHCAKMRFLMQDLKLNEDRETLKKILVHALPETNDDKVVLYVKVDQEKFINIFHAKEHFGRLWSALQITTACSACAVMDEVLRNVNEYQGIVLQEEFTLNVIKENQFGSIMFE